MIEVSGISKSYGGKSALKSLSFTAKPGGVTGLLGRNGAGKSTTMNIITGYISSDAGSVAVDGIDMAAEPLLAKKHIGYLPEQPPLYTEMTVTEYLVFAARLKGVKAGANSHIGSIMDMTGIGNVRGRLIGNLSKGMRQRVGLAQALVGDPAVLILDEPTVGLDPAQIIEIRSIIKRLGEERTLILSSHILKEIADICTHVVILSEGVKVADDSMAALLNTSGGRRAYIMRVRSADNRNAAILRAIDGVVEVNTLPPAEDGCTDYEIISDGGDIRERLFFTAAEHVLPVVELRPAGLSLEEVFTRLTEREEEA